MIRKTIKILIVFFAVALNSFGLDDSIENGWKGIKPLKTDKVTVEKILGKPTASMDGFYNYDLPDAFVHINYTNEPCQKAYHGRGKYDVLEDTVLDYQITLQQDVKLKDLKFQREKYERQIDPEQNKLIYYINRDDAILIKVSIVDNIEYVGQIIFDPSPADKKKFACKKPEAANNTPQKSKTVETPNCKKPK